MNRLAVVIGFASLVIVACMIYLVKTGISLTPAVMIKPSHFDGQGTVAHAVVTRLFPQFSENPVWHFKNTSVQTQETIAAIVGDIQKAHPSLKIETSNLTVDDKLLATDGEPHLYVQEFSKSDFALSPHCESMKRLDYKCFVEVSLHKSRRKMKEPDTKYFLMTSYVDKHYLLLIQTQ